MLYLRFGMAGFLSRNCKKYCLNLLIKNFYFTLVISVFNDFIKKIKFNIMVINQINLNSNVFQWLGIQEFSEKEKIKKMLDDVDSEEYPYIENSTEQFDIILSPNAFEMLLGKMQPNDCLSLITFEINAKVILPLTQVDKIQ